MKYLTIVLVCTGCAVIQPDQNHVVKPTHDLEQVEGIIKKL